MTRLPGLTLIDPDDLIQLRRDPKTGLVNNPDLRHALHELSMELSTRCALNRGEERYKDVTIAFHILHSFDQPWDKVRQHLEYKEAVGWAMTELKKDLELNGKMDFYNEMIAPLVRTVCESFHMEERDYSLDKDNLRRLKIEVQRTSIPPRDFFGG